jgi:molybdopterin converting factor subunit 1
MKLQVRYFARLRERFACDAEVLAVSADIATVADLITLLLARGGVWAEELGAGRVYRVALDQELADPTAPLHEGAEVAIFPPVTGG